MLIELSPILATSEKWHPSRLKSDHFLTQTVSGVVVGDNARGTERALTPQLQVIIDSLRDLV